MCTTSDCCGPITWPIWQLWPAEKPFPAAQTPPLLLPREEGITSFKAKAAGVKCGNGGKLQENFFAKMEEDLRIAEMKFS